MLHKKIRLHKLLLFWLIVLLFSCSKKSGGGSTGGGGNNPPTPVWDPNALRGVWVTNVASTALDSKENIKTCVQNCKLAGINNIFMVVYNKYRTMYPSMVMQNLLGTPIQESFSGRDPLKEMIDEAHAAGIKVHAWFEYGFASSFGQNTGGPIIQAKSHWAARDASGAILTKNSFQWLNAFHPEVQQFMIDLFKEVITNYDIDGVQGDDRLPALPSTGGYDAYTMNLFKTENGIDPPGDYRETFWLNWRIKKLNDFMKRLRNEVKTLKPNVQLTVSPSPYPFGRDEYLQDWPAWVDSGWVDAVIPQCYRYDINVYNATVAQQKNFHRNTNIPLYPGVLLKSGSTIQPDALLTQMIQTNRRNGYKGEVFFFYEGIKDRKSWFEGQYPFTF